jgi:CheY-like chemotaxis protein
MSTIGIISWRAEARLSWSAYSSIHVSRYGIEAWSVVVARRGASPLGCRAPSGREALDALERETFGRVLMDVEMPIVNGWEATEAIRAKEKGTGAHAPIPAMTAHAMKGDCDRCLAAGMDAYVTKPIGADTLRQAIEELLATLAQIARSLLSSARTALRALCLAKLPSRVPSPRKGFSTRPQHMPHFLFGHAMPVNVRQPCVWILAEPDFHRGRLRGYRSKSPARNRHAAAVPVEPSV